MKSRRRLLKVLLGVVVLSVLAAAVFGLGPADKEPVVAATVAVSRGVVLASVSATGNVTADTELGLDFASGGRLVDLAVEEGERVTRGQVLARVDGRAGNDNLASARADLASAQAELNRVREGTTAEERAANRASVGRAQSQVDAAEVALDGAEATAGQNNKDYAADINQARTAVSQARARAERNRKTYQSDVDQAEDDLDDAQRAASAASGDDIVGRLTGALRSPEADLRAARARVTTAKNTQRTGLLTDQQAIKNATDEVTNATNRSASGQLADEQAIRDASARRDSAKADVVGAQADVAVAQTPASAAEVAAAAAGVTRAQVGVKAAERELEDSTLVAPVDGTVASVANQVGEFVSGSGVGGLSGTGTSAEATSGLNTTATTNGFIVLTDLGSLQVKAGFSEVDAAKLQPGQAVVLSFEALPSQAAAGRVAAVDAVSTLVRNVVTYDVTVIPDQSVAGIKPGMTASVQVVVAERTNVARLPNSAIGGRSDRATVTVLRADKELPRPVTVGVRGDDSTEILNGVAVGDRVLTRASSVVAAGGGGSRP